jgi:hypothetical protein
MMESAVVDSMQGSAINNDSELLAHYSNQFRDFEERNTILVRLLEDLQFYMKERMLMAGTGLRQQQEGSADQRISGGWCSHGGAEARRKHREEPTTRHPPQGQLACLVLLPVC